jgi:phosphoenolpyruvate synthase/pyruvate phosphate dikinase
MKYINAFTKINKDDVLTAGGKGASLGEMTGADIPVPPGFVLISIAFDEFLKETDLNIELDAILDQVDHNVISAVDKASIKITSLIMGAEMPTNISNEIIKAHEQLGVKYVAVRSSATAEDSKDAAWAGQLDTFLNTDKDTLLENVKKCWASLFTPRAIFYGFEKGFHVDKDDKKHKGKAISVAVVVQEMVESEQSGIVFSVHPVTQDHDQLIIEAGLGLGEAIVSGLITPDSYVVEKSTEQILDKNISTQERGLFRGEEGGTEWKDIPTSEGEKSVLSDKEVLELARMVVNIEKHYGFPVDVEWAKARGKFYITQSRPITTLTSGQQAQSGKYEFSWGEMHSVISTESWLRGYVRLRDLIANENKNVFMYVKKGQVHTYNLSSDVPAALKAGEAVLDHKFLDEHLAQSKRVREEFKDIYEETKQADFQALSDENLAIHYEKYQDLFERTWAYFKVSQPEYLEAAKEKLEELIKKKSSGGSLENQFIILTTPLEMDLIKEEEVAALERSFERIDDESLWRHAQEYPWLFFNTFNKDVIHKFLETKFSDLKSVSEDERKEHIEQAKENLKRHSEKHKELLEQLGSDPDISYLSRVFGELAVDRLRMKAWWGGAEFLFLPMFEEISNRAGISVTKLLMSYTVDNMLMLLREGKRLSNENIEDRRKLYAVALENGDYSFNESEQARKKYEELIGEVDSSSEGSEEITGVSANVGRAKGKARIIVVEDLKRLLEDMDRFKEGDIMVTTMTQPTMVSLARKAAAIVTNEGGITSHASILAREYGIPCIVGTRTATFVIKDGDEIEVDADKGVVKVIKRA